jgi:hypothetical protein
MTKEEVDLLYSLAQDFDEDFSKLVNETVRKAPESIRDALIAMMQDSASVYAALD